MHLSLLRPFLLFALLSLGLQGTAFAQAFDLTRMSLEELMEVEVSLVTRKAQSIGRTAAAAYALGGEELRRAGLSTLPDALRLVPGMQVARVDANKWAVTSRGFPGVFANKLLVLIDGRSVYTPLFSGVFWESQDAILEDLERIEVVRGPGGTLWGANAVNGIVNVVSRPSGETQGTLLQVGGGTHERAFATLRHGGALGPGAHYRAYGRFFTRGRSAPAGSQEPRDDWRAGRGGARLDWAPSPWDALTLQGEFYTGEIGQSLVIARSMEAPYTGLEHVDARVGGGHLLGRWQRELDQGAWTLQFYADRTRRRERVLKGTIHTADVDFQHRLPLGSRQELAWGLGYRHIADRFEGSFTMSLDPARRRTHLLSAFVHHELEIAPSRLHLTTGAKLERNSYTGVEIQPNARLAWTPTSDRMYWIAATRAVRTPSRSEHDFRGVVQILPPDALFRGAPVTRVELLGDPSFGSEHLLAVEAGQRAKALGLALDLTLFYHRYYDLRTNEPGLPFRVEDPAPHLIVPLRVANRARGESYGAEAAADWPLRRGWRLRAAYSYLDLRLRASEDSFDTLTETFAGEIPRHQFNLRSYLDLGARSTLDAVLRYAGSLSAQDIEAYLSLDLRLGWKFAQGLELALVGRDLLASPHAEFVSRAAATLPSQVERGAHAVLIWSP